MTPSNGPTTSPLFDPADDLETPTDCADFLLDLFRDGGEGDVRRGLAAVSRTTGYPADDLPADVLDLLFERDAERAVETRAMMDRLGIDMGGRPVSPA